MKSWVNRCNDCMRIAGHLADRNSVLWEGIPLGEESVENRLIAKDLSQLRPENQLMSP